MGQTLLVVGIITCLVFTMANPRYIGAGGALGQGPAPNPKDFTFSEDEKITLKTYYAIICIYMIIFMLFIFFTLISKYFCKKHVARQGSHSSVVL